LQTVKYCGHWPSDESREAPEGLNAGEHSVRRIYPKDGKLFMTTETPFFRSSQKSGFLKSYEKKKSEGELWPGLTYDVQKI
jgi:hypothetical protein